MNIVTDITINKKVTYAVFHLRKIICQLLLIHEQQLHY